MGQLYTKLGPDHTTESSELNKGQKNIILNLRKEKRKKRSKKPKRDGLLIDAVKYCTEKTF